ncbi:unnamed protein product [Arctogadus glacialis]
MKQLHLKNDIHYLKLLSQTNQQNQNSGLVLVVDHAEYKKYGSRKTVAARMLAVVNHVDKLYRSLGTRMMLVGLEIWTYGDQIEVSPDPSGAGRGEVEEDRGDPTQDTGDPHTGHRGPPHRTEGTPTQDRGDPHTGQREPPHRTEGTPSQGTPTQDRGDPHTGDPHRGDPNTGQRGPSHRTDGTPTQDRGDPHKGDPHTGQRGTPHWDPHTGDTHTGHRGPPTEDPAPVDGPLRLNEALLGAQHMAVPPSLLVPPEH